MAWAGAFPYSRWKTITSHAAAGDAHNLFSCVYRTVSLDIREFRVTLALPGHHQVLITSTSRMAASNRTVTHW